MARQIYREQPYLENVYSREAKEIDFIYMLRDYSIEYFPLATRPIAREFFDAYGCEAEILTGDFYTDDLGGPYDIVFSSFNRSNSDIRMCRKVFESVAPGGLLIMRRHLDPGQASPLSILEWNLITYDDAPKGEKRFHGSWMPTSDEYMTSMTEMGMETVNRVNLDSGSELVIMRRP